jgi:hypothetical protein
MQQNIVGDELELILDPIERFSSSMNLQVIGNPLHVVELLHDLCSIAFLAHEGDGSLTGHEHEEQLWISREDSGGTVNV